jgi:hypothetical protein
MAVSAVEEYIIIWGRQSRRAGREVAHSNEVIRESDF